jgi:hypothetical protein
LRRLRNNRLVARRGSIRFPQKVVDLTMTRPAEDAKVRRREQKSYIERSVRILDVVNGQVRTVFAPPAFLARRVGSKPSGLKFFPAYVLTPQRDLERLRFGCRESVFASPRCDAKTLSGTILPRHAVFSRRDTRRHREFDAALFAFDPNRVSSLPDGSAGIGTEYVSSSPRHNAANHGSADFACGGLRTRSLCHNSARRRTINPWTPRTGKLFPAILARVFLHRKTSSEVLYSISANTGEMRK